MSVGGSRMSTPVALFECLLALQHDADVFVDDMLRLAFRFHAPVEKKNRPIGKLLDQSEIMRHKEDRGLLFAQFLEFADTAIRENRVANRESFIHDQNVR